MEKEFIGTAMAREAGDFFTRHAAAPWFLYYALNLVHTPHDVLPQHLARVPASVTDEKRRRYLASVAAMDDSVGLVLERLRALGQEERTLIFFLSDNGGGFGSDNRPLKGGKGQTADGGIRVPFFAQWKGVIPAGRVLDQPVISLDLLPTALAAAGTTTDPAWKLDGANLLPLLKGDSDAAPHPEGLFWRFGDQWAVRLGDWKLAQYGSRKLSPIALHNLAQDVSEKTNLITNHPEKERELRTAWERWNQANIPTRWVLKE
jgi:arylsulfatase A-like enzyme